MQKIITDLKLPAKVWTTTDQRRAISGSAYVIVTIMVGGFKHYESDGAIPLKYGVQPTVGDTDRAGAVMRLIRTAPVLNEITQNCANWRPDAWIFNYTNPMAMVTWTLLNGHEKVVGLCHSIQGAYHQIAGFLGIPADEVRYTAGGINHVDFYITLTHKGKDLYPLLLAKKDEILAKHPSLRVKFELLESIGGWPAEGEMHQNEYYPWFNKNEAMAREYASETMWGFHFDKRINGELDQIVEDQISGKRPIDYRRSHEYGAWMIHSIADEHAADGLWQRAQSWADREPAGAGGGGGAVPCGCSGVLPCRLGRIPMPLAAAMAPHCALHEMAVEAVAQDRSQPDPPGHPGRPADRRGAHAAEDPPDDR